MGGGAAAGAASLSSDSSKTDSKATPAVRAVPRTGEKCKKCPPEAGTKIRRNHGPNWDSYRYQAHITGFAFDEAECRWSEEWQWEGIDFDGFVPGECLLQEAKANYDQFIDGSKKNSDKWFTGFDRLEVQAGDQAEVVHANPPSKLRWYFQTPLTQKKMAPMLASVGIQSVLQP
nr:restriction endonuclease fold toxin 5 domain-containing protein [Paraburkholderia sp. Ac-20342]